MKEIKIASNSGTLSASLFKADSSDIILVIASATGVKQEYYHKFAHYLSGHGVSVITFDYTGIGRSLTKPIKQLTNNTADWGRNDLESVLQYVLQNYTNSKKVILGHSIGGQILGLAKSSTKFDKIILVAAQSGYWKLWDGMDRIKMWFNWYILFPAILNIFGYLNSKKLSGMENLPKNAASQWLRWGKHPDYLQSDTSIDLKYYDTIEQDLCAFSIEDDRYAPLKAVEWMTSQYRNSKSKSIHLKPSDFNVEGIGHFGLFKERFKPTIWQILLDEII